MRERNGSYHQQREHPKHTASKSYAAAEMTTIGPNWTTTFAYHYTQGLRTELETKIISCYATSWIDNGLARTLSGSDDSTPDSEPPEDTATNRWKLARLSLQLKAKRHPTPSQ